MLEKDDREGEEVTPTYARPEEPDSSWRKKSGVEINPAGMSG